MRNEGVRKSNGERVVYMVYDYSNREEIFDFIDRWGKKNDLKYFRNNTLSTNFVWDDGTRDYIALKIGYHIIIDACGYVRIFNQPTFERFYEKYIPDNIEYVFFNG